MCVFGDSCCKKQTGSKTGKKKKRESLTKQINNLSYMLEKDIISAVIYNQEYLEQVSDYLNMSSIAYNWGTCFVLSVGQTQ